MKGFAAAWRDRAAGSLALRLFLTSLLWSALALAGAAWLLMQLYTNSLVRSFDERIIVFEKTLAGVVADTPIDSVPDPGTMGDPRFARFQSGWYWLVRNPKTREVVAASQSLLGEVLDLPDPPNNGIVVTDEARDPAGTHLRRVTQRIFLSGGRTYDLFVTGNVEELSGEISVFGFQVLATLAVFALGMMIASLLQVRIGLKPLDAMIRSLAAIREGRASHLEGRFPSELAPLAKELNALIEANGAIVERSRTQVGNLAHALKTPLAVLLNEARADGGPLAEKMIEQAGAMQSEVQRYLDRARLAADRKVVGAKANVLPSLEGLAKVMRRAHPDRAISVETDPAAIHATARIERRDLEEAIGNLMDNACKFGREQVEVELGFDDADRYRPLVVIKVHDDGPGLEACQFSTVLGRGKRLDETVPGSGLGLAVAAEIVETYGGSIGLGRGPLGGLSVEVKLPAA